jgi:transposase
VERILTSKPHPEPIRAVAWKAQLRLGARYRRLQNTGKPQNIIVVTIARELAAFVWSIARMAQPSTAPA